MSKVNSRIVCPVCDCEIDPETGEGFYKKGTNAGTIEDVRAEKAELQTKLANMKVQYDNLLNNFNLLKNGEIEDVESELDGDGDGDEYESGFKFPWQ